VLQPQPITHHQLDLNIVLQARLQKQVMTYWGIAVESTQHADLRDFSSTVW
jgi:hypothetical protein